MQSFLELFTSPKGFDIAWSLDQQVCYARFSCEEIPLKVVNSLKYANFEGVQITISHVSSMTDAIEYQQA